MNAPGFDTRRSRRFGVWLLAAWALAGTGPAAAQAPAPLPFWDTSTQNLGAQAAKDARALGLLFDLPAGVYTPKTDADSQKPRGWLGVALQDGDVKVAPPSVQITRMFPDSPAQAAGLLPGDSIVGLDHQPLSRGQENAVLYHFRKQVARAGPGRTLLLELLREGRRLEASPRLAAPPSAPARLRDFGRASPPPRTAPSLLHHGLNAQGKLAAFTDFLSALRQRADEVVSTAVKGDGYNPFRLSTVTSLLHRPFALARAGQDLASRIDAGLQTPAPRLELLIETGAEALDLTLPEKPPAAAPRDLSDWLQRLVEVIVQAQAMIRQARAGLSADEVEHLEAWVDDWLHSKDGPEEASPEEKLETERRTLRFLHLALKVDLRQILGAARAVAAALDPAALQSFSAAGAGLTRIPDGWSVTEEPGLTRLNTPAGRVLIGGPGPNVYREEAVLILDLGGDDVYHNRAGGAEPGRPVAVVVDLNGDDRYLARAAFSQGAGFLGAGFLLDLNGDDWYAAENLAQGAGVFGLGLLADLGGDDRYLCRALCQAGAAFGLGLVAEGGGRDQYTAALMAQGFGFVKGYAALADGGGDDTYFAGGLEADHRQPHKATKSLAQGFGYGLRPWESLAGASGGIGILFDRAGNDTYVADYFAQGASYWLALGMLADGGGHDKYIAGRYAQGAGIHYSVGLLMDAAGEDEYVTHFGVSQGCGHDFGVGQLFDFSGDDRYVGGVLSQGAGSLNGLGVLADTGGNDAYLVQSQGQGWGHWESFRELGSFGFLFDTGGGTDTYMPAAGNNTLTAPTPWSVKADTR